MQIQQGKQDFTNGFFKGLKKCGEKMAENLAKKWRLGVNFTNIVQLLCQYSCTKKKKKPEV